MGWHAWTCHSSGFRLTAGDTLHKACRQLTGPPLRCPSSLARAQGSNDGQAWSDLRRHIGDCTLKMPGQYASWPLIGHAAAVPYRLFRVLLIGPNPEAENPYHVCLSYLELYGYLRVAAPA